MHPPRRSLPAPTARPAKLVLPLSLLSLLALSSLEPSRAFGAPPRRAKIAVIGGGLAGVVAATVAAEEALKKIENDDGDGGGDDAASSSSWSAAAATVTLFTSSDSVMPHWRRLHEKGRNSGSESPVLPDPTLPERKLIDAYPSGGREMAGILSKRCTPARLRGWLEGHDVALEETTIAGLDGPLVKEKPLVQIGERNLADAAEGAARDAGVNIRAGVSVTAVSKKTTDDDSDIISGGFVVSLGEGSDRRREVFDCVILAGEDADFSSAVAVAAASDAAVPAAPNSRGEDDDDALDLSLGDEPLSRKERMDLEKKRKKAMKKQQKRDKAAERSDTSGVEEGVATLSLKEDGISSDGDAEENGAASPDNEQALKIFDMASAFGHRVADPVPGMFSFTAGSETAKGGMLHGCAEGGELIPKARLSVKLDAPPLDDGGGNGGDGKSKRRARSLPKYSGPIVVECDRVTGSAALRLSSIAARQLHGSTPFDLHLHLAPDVGSVEAVEGTLLDPSSDHRLANDVASESCPLLRREIDYDDYDVDAGQFRRIEAPMAPRALWRNLCRRASIPPTARWGDVPDKKIRALAHLTVDCPLRITGVRPPVDDDDGGAEFATSGGVSLREIDMTTTESKLCDGLFFCGTGVLDVHGFHGGFNSLASLSTGYLAGRNAAAKACQ